MEIEAVNEITQGESAKQEETRAKDRTTGIADVCDWLRKDTPENEN